MSHTTSAESQSQSEILSRLLRLPLWVYCLIAAVFYALCELRAHPYELVTSLGDTDDALRLAELRDFLANGDWFDRTFERLGGDDPLVSHWSRLIDLPLALMIAVLGLVMPYETAELVTRAIWPVLVLFALMRFFARHVEIRGGRIAAIVVIGLIMYASAVTVQFNPGRVDHHNVMITAAGSGILFLIEAVSAPRMGWIAGALLGFGTAVGFESLSLTAAALAISSLFAVATGHGLEGMRNAALGFASTLACLFLLTVPPALWTVVRCDELSLNLIFLSAAGVAGLAAASLPEWKSNAVYRLAVLAGAGAIGLVGFTLLEPQCLGGPFAQADPAIKPIWLDHVEETNHILETFALMPQIAFIFSVTSVLGVWAAYRQWSRHRDAGSLLMGILLVLAIVLTLWQVKFVPYAALLALPAFATEIAELDATEQMTALTRRLIAFFLANQHSMLAVATLCAAALSLGGSAMEGSTATELDKSSKKREACYATENMKELAALSPGTFAGHFDLGPFIVANTHHSALMGPYHRLDRALIKTHAISSAVPAAAERLLKDAGATYVIDCVDLKPMPLIPKEGLIPQLKAGHVPGYLEPVVLSRSNPLRVWRVK